MNPNFSDGLLDIREIDSLSDQQLKNREIRTLRFANSDRRLGFRAVSNPPITLPGCTWPRIG
jgi:hypothetical protein